MNNWIGPNENKVEDVAFGPTVPTPIIFSSTPSLQIFSQKEVFQDIKANRYKRVRRNQSNLT